MVNIAYVRRVHVYVNFMGPPAAAAGAITIKPMSIDFTSIHTTGLTLEEFKPDGFIDTDSHKYGTDSFIPFSSGARACVGRECAKVEMVAILVTACRSYGIVLPESMQVPPEDKARYAGKGATE
ncbi:hypothetical protein P389DRAFT_190363 [Cystobasidium minutum MCA 4210]|uniref:uncharacterized protein n=1 Tax=Cystobasidium minutum MCA 4210 TaxID=1397322 RepID=UPI0034CEDB90|eukprot:jgi/Rhomi1/190363/estExt_fgenesh1_pg.C_5_t10145